MSTDTMNRAQAPGARLESISLQAFPGIECESMIRRSDAGLRSLDQPPESQFAYQYCADLTRESSKSFYLSTAFLPAEARRSIRAFYAFCRLTDDLVDAPERRHAQDLNEWRLQARLPARAQRHPVLYAWAQTRDRYSIPHHLIEELIDGCAMDLTIRRYETFADLRVYCYRVASTVGLVSMHIIGLFDQSPQVVAAAHAAATELGVALQLTNILRDVGEDLARGRIYLPLEDLRRFDYSEADLQAGVNDDRFKALMRFEIERAYALYDANWQAIACLRPEGRLAVGAALWLYRGILDRIVDNGFDVFTRRAHLTNLEKLARIPGIYRRIAQLPPANAFRTSSL